MQEDWVKDGEGRRRRAHKRYVDVFMRLTDEGRFDPLIVMWPDGRAFPISEVLDRGSFGPAYRGVSTARYRVRVGSHVTNLFLERHVFDATLGKPPVVRWWVEAYIVSIRGGRVGAGAPCAVGSSYAFAPEVAFFGEGASSFASPAVRARMFA